MAEEAEEELGFNAAPPLVSLTPFSPASTRRLSSCFVRPSRPVPAARRLAWVSLQGRILDAEEASSARAIKGGLAPDEAAAWELFSPIQRFLIVAVIGVAVAESKKNGLIFQLKKSVEFRDRVLSSMQQKLDNLCEQLNNVKDHPETENISLSSIKLPDNEVFGPDKTKFVDCGCWLCDQHHNLFNKFAGSSVTKDTGGDEILQYKMSLSNVAEQEERRMSDLSDWASSVTSAAEIQMNTLAIEQDIYNLKRDCEDKDATIKELTTLLHSTDMAGSKRIVELEDIIKRKNTMITRLKKDMIVLEQKVVNLTRFRRPSFSSSESPAPSILIPHLTDNLLYDMDSTTSPSSSDSDSSPLDQAQTPVPKTPEIPAQSFEFHSTRDQNSMPTKPSGPMARPKDKHSKSRSVSPLKEISMNRKSLTISSSRQRQFSANGDTKRSRRLHLSAQKDTTPHKRWV
ncbi:inactive rhomboid protein [Trema orientale]|uniref:Inactive rhomboid protein n=1 Tax=Trema orientale TaxID=63057 RepID=A0A2P5EUL3_TREOI|nr:inactive rhomboid protein [Trema orientale]